MGARTSYWDFQDVKVKGADTPDESCQDYEVFFNRDAEPDSQVKPPSSIKSFVGTKCADIVPLQHTARFALLSGQTPLVEELVRTTFAPLFAGKRGASSCGHTSMRARLCGGVPPP